MLTDGEKWAMHVMNYRVEGIRANRATIKVPARPDLGREGFEEPNHLAAAVAAGNVAIDYDQLADAIVRRVLTGSAT